MFILYELFFISLILSLIDYDIATGILKIFYLAHLDIEHLVPNSTTDSRKGKISCIDKPFWKFLKGFFMPGRSKSQLLKNIALAQQFRLRKFNPSNEKFSRKVTMRGVILTFCVFLSQSRAGNFDICLLKCHDDEAPLKVILWFFQTHISFVSKFLLRDERHVHIKTIFSRI